MADTHDTIPLGQWKAGAKALAAFQQAAYAAGKSGKAQGRAFSSLKDICKTIQVAGKDLGLAHSECWRPLGTDHALLRVTLHHDSGESIWSELPVDITQKNRSGSREQAQGSAMTYARRYLLLGIYGLANDDEDDDGEATTTDATSKTSRSSTTTVSREPLSPSSVTVSEPKSTPQPTAAPEVDDNNQSLTKEEKDLALAIIKDPESGADCKKQFMAKFYPSADKLFPNMISAKEHLVFLDAIHTNILF